MRCKNPLSSIEDCQTRSLDPPPPPSASSSFLSAISPKRKRQLEHHAHHVPSSSTGQTGPQKQSTLATPLTPSRPARPMVTVGNVEFNETATTAINPCPGVPVRHGNPCRFSLNAFSRQLEYYVRRAPPMRGMQNSSRPPSRKHSIENEATRFLLFSGSSRAVHSRHPVLLFPHKTYETHRA